jgi:hypothetical protein
VIWKESLMVWLSDNVFGWILKPFTEILWHILFGLFLSLGNFFYYSVLFCEYEKNFWS